MTKLIAAVVLALVAAALGFQLVRVLRQSDVRQDYLRTIRSMRWWMLPAALGQLVVVVVAYYGITRLVPALSWGWWRLVGGSGNIVLGQSGQSGIGWTTAGIALPVAFFFAIPALAHGEEVMFRRGAEDQSVARRLMTQFKFGLYHFTAGIPVGVCLALTISGIYFMAVYLADRRRLDATIPAVEELPKPAQLPYPELSAATVRDDRAWAAHDREWRRVHAENRRSFDLWSAEVDGLIDARVEATVERFRQIRSGATATAAAAHAVSNWVAITIFAVAMIVLVFIR